jgi:hypothetical protein
MGYRASRDTAALAYDPPILDGHLKGHDQLTRIDLNQFSPATGVHCGSPSAESERIGGALCHTAAFPPLA